jgi:hypothetical protein
MMQVMLVHDETIDNENTTTFGVNFILEMQNPIELDTKIHLRK